MIPNRKATITRHEHRTFAPHGFGAGTLAARLAIVMMCAAATTLTAAAHADEVVLKDHTMSWWDGILIGQRYLEPAHFSNMGASAPFTSNGGTLSRVGIVWAHTGSGSGQCNGGSASNWGWRFMYWPSTADFLNDPWGDDPNGPVTVHTFSNPTNPDWYSQIGMAGCYHLYYAEVNVGFLNITLPDNGQIAHVMLVPDLPGAATTASGSLAFSHGFGGAIGMEPDWFVNVNVGPDTLESLDAPQPWSAYRITATAPKSPCIPADLNCDGVVNVSDLLILLGAWGACTEPDACPADLNDDGVVNVSDLLMLLANWG